MPFPFIAIRPWEVGPLGGASQYFACEPSDRSQPGLLVRPDALQRRVPQPVPEALPVLDLDHDGRSHPHRRRVRQFPEVVPQVRDGAERASLPAGAASDRQPERLPTK